MAIDNSEFRRMANKEGRKTLRKIYKILSFPKYANSDVMIEALQNARKAIEKYRYAQVLDERTYAKQARQIKELENIVSDQSNINVKHDEEEHKTTHFTITIKKSNYSVR